MRRTRQALGVKRRFRLPTDSRSSKQLTGAHLACIIRMVVCAAASLVGSSALCRATSSRALQPTRGGFPGV